MLCTCHAGSYLFHRLFMCRHREEKKRGGGVELRARGGASAVSANNPDRAAWKLLPGPGRAVPVPPCPAGGGTQPARGRAQPAGLRRFPPPAGPSRFPPGQAPAAGPGPGASAPVRPRRCPGAKGGLSPPTPLALVGRWGSCCLQESEFTLK